MIVACEEPDYRWAIGAGECALAQAELEVPAELLSNLGVAHMNLDELDQATSYFERALTCKDVPTLLEMGIRVNLSISLRRRNQLPQAEAVLVTAEAIVTLEDPRIRTRAGPKRGQTCLHQTSHPHVDPAAARDI